MNPICGVNQLLDGSFATFLPTAAVGDKANMVQMENPWKRTYSVVNHMAEWQNPDANAEYCDRVRSSPPFDVTSKLLDLIDLHIFDFLIGMYSQV